MNTAAEIACTLHCEKWLTVLPDVEAICHRAASAALGAADESAIGARVIGSGEIGVVLADDDLVQDLNRRYRGIDRATNVLAFPLTEADPMSEAGPMSAAESTRRDGPLGEPGLLGDVVIALESTAREAAEQNKPLSDHLSHLVVHGTLHLLGFDHEVEEEASRMERLEIETLAGLGVADPYAANTGPANSKPANSKPAGVEP